MSEQNSLSVADVVSAPCGCDEMSICTECASKRAVACPGLPGKHECGRGATSPGEIRLYGHCVLCESIVDAERRFREAETGRKANQNLNELPLPGYVRHIDACRFLGLCDSLLKAFDALKHQELEAVTLIMHGGTTAESLVELVEKCVGKLYSLRKQNKELKEALNLIADLDTFTFGHPVQIARATLEAVKLKVL